MFSCEIFEIFKNTYFEKHFRTNVSVYRLTDILKAPINIHFEHTDGEITHNKYHGICWFTLCDVFFFCKYHRTKPSSINAYVQMKFGLISWFFIYSTETFSKRIINWMQCYLCQCIMGASGIFWLEWPTIALWCFIKQVVGKWYICNGELFSYNQH